MESLSRVKYQRLETILQLNVSDNVVSRAASQAMANCLDQVYEKFCMTIKKMNIKQSE